MATTGNVPAMGFKAGGIKYVTLFGFESRHVAGTFTDPLLPGSGGTASVFRDPPLPGSGGTWSTS